MCVCGGGYLKLQPFAPAFKEHMYICSIDVHLASCRALSESSHGMKWSDCGNKRIQGGTLEEPANEVGCSLFSSIIRTMKLIFILFSRDIEKWYFFESECTCLTFQRLGAQLPWVSRSAAAFLSAPSPVLLSWINIIILMPNLPLHVLLWLILMPDQVYLSPVRACIYSELLSKRRKLYFTLVWHQVAIETELWR